MRVLVALLLGVALAGEAQASSCPWHRIERLYADIRTVYVNDVPYPVAGPYNRGSFARVLEVCGRRDAIPYFEAWRVARRNTNITVGVSIAAFWPAVVLAALPANTAGQRRDEMLYVLYHGPLAQERAPR